MQQITSEAPATAEALDLDRRVTSKAAAPAEVEKDYSRFLLEDLAEHLGKSVDDIVEDTAAQFFCDDGYFKEGAQRRKDARELIQNYLLPLNRQHALINVAGSFGVADFRSLDQPRSYNPDIERAWTPQTLPDMHTLGDFAVRYEDRRCTIIRGGKHVSKKVTDVWREWKYRRTYMRGFLLAPGIDQKDLPENFNTWRGWPINADPSKPHRPEAWATLRKHFEEAYFPHSKREAEWFYSWLADIFQNPMSKPESAIVLRGKKGAGKSLLADVLKRIIGMRHFARLDKPEQLTGQFNGHLQSTILVDVEEAFFSGDKRAEGVLKSWITSEDVQIRLMRTDGFQAKNFSRFLFTSNEAWVVPVTQDERRFFVVDVTDKFLGNKAHFNLLWTELRHTGGLEEFARFLLQWKKPQWVMLNQPPKTQALARQFEESLDQPKRFFWNAVKTGENYPCPEGGTFYRQDVMQQFADWCRENKAPWAATNDKLFASLAEEFWHAKKLNTRKLDPATRKKETVYEVPSLADLRTILMEKWDLHDDAFDNDDDDGVEAD